MEKKYFYIGLLGFLLMSEIWGMQEDLEFQDFQPLEDIPLDVNLGCNDNSAIQISYQEAPESLCKRKPSRLMERRKKARVNSQIPCMYPDCRYSFEAKSQEKIFNAFMKHISSKHAEKHEHDLARSQIEKAEWDEQESRWVVRCLKDGCAEEKFVGGWKNKSSLTQQLIRHWYTKAHNAAKCTEIQDYIAHFNAPRNLGSRQDQSLFAPLFPELIGLVQEDETVNQHISSAARDSVGLFAPASSSLPSMMPPSANSGGSLLSKVERKSKTERKSIVADSVGSDSYSLKCIYPRCGIWFEVKNKFNLFTSLQAHVYGQVHNGCEYGRCSDYIRNKHFVEGRRVSVACPEEGCADVVSLKSNKEHHLCKPLLKHLHSKKHDKQSYELLRAYVYKSFPTLFKAKEKKYPEQHFAQVVDEYIRLYPDQKEFQEAVYEK